MSADLTTLIVTALRVEYDAVRAHLNDVGESHDERGVSFREGFLATAGAKLRVGIAQLLEAGNDEAALGAFEAARHFKPDIMMFVGIAGGIKDVGLGDVVVATKVYGYTSGAAEEEFLPRPDVGESNEWLLQQALFISQGDTWASQSRAEGSRPRVFVGPIAAGPVVLKSRDSDIFKFLRRQYGDALAVEMEGRGFLRAARKNDLARAIVIRGISDRIDDKSSLDGSDWQSKAASNAAAFAIALLTRGSDLWNRRPDPRTGSGSDAWDDWYETLLSEGSVFYDDPWKRWTSEAERDFKNLIKGRWDKQFNYMHQKAWEEIIELWEPLQSNEYFNVENLFWQDKPYFRCQIHSANAALFVSHAQMATSDADENFAHYRKAIHYLREVLKEHPYSMLGASSERLSTEDARAQNENFVTTLEFAKQFLKGWGGLALQVIDISEEEGEEIEKAVQTRLNEILWVLYRHPPP